MLGDDLTDFDGAFGDQVLAAAERQEKAAQQDEVADGCD